MNGNGNVKSVHASYYLKKMQKNINLRSLKNDVATVNAKYNLHFLLVKNS